MVLVVAPGTLFDVDPVVACPATVAVEVIVLDMLAGFPVALLLGDVRVANVLMTVAVLPFESVVV